MKLKKWLILLIALGLAFTQAHAYDDDDEEEEIVKPVKKAAAPAKKAAKDASESGSFKLGFYGSLVGGVNMLSAGISTGDSEDDEEIPDFSIASPNKVGVLFNLGNGLEINFGIGILRYSQTVEMEIGKSTQTSEGSLMVYEIVIGAAYQLGKTNFISYGTGLDISLSSWSMTFTEEGESVTVEPEGMTMIFTPNFYVKAEIVKDFYVDLKAGLTIAIPPSVERTGYSQSSMLIGTKTEVGVSYYIF